MWKKASLNLKDYCYVLCNTMSSSGIIWWLSEGQNILFWNYPRRPWHSQKFSSLHVHFFSRIFILTLWPKTSKRPKNQF